MINTICIGIDKVLAIKSNGDLIELGKEKNQLKVMENVKSIAVSDTYNIVLKNNRSLWGWGENIDGELGIDSEEIIEKPVEIMGNVIDVVSFCGSTLIIKLDNSLWAFSTMTNNKLPIKIMENTKKIFLSEQYGFAINDKDELWKIDFKKLDKNGLKKVMDDVDTISASFEHVLVIKKDKTLWGMGNNEYGQLGDGSVSKRIIEKKIMDDVKFIDTSFDKSMAIKYDGSLYKWGKVNTETKKTSLFQKLFIRDSSELMLKPEKMMDNVKIVKIGMEHCMILKNDNSLWLLGENEKGQIGDGTREKINVPTKILDDINEISLDDECSVALKNDGKLFAWGELGFKKSLLPIKIMDDVLLSESN